jgi:hypothetical protein
MTNYTTHPMTIAAESPVAPEFMRLPPPGGRDPVFGLSRTTLNELILPMPENGHRPPVRSVVLRKRGAKTGTRLIDLASLRAYINQHVEPTYQETSPNAGEAGKGVSQT